MTAGCSFVWGDELDGYDTNPPSHWEHTFTHKLAKKLNLKPDIIGQCGNGNDKIYRDVIDYLSDPKKENPAMIFVSWSALQRIELYEEKKIGEEENMKIKRWQQMSQFSPERTGYLNKGNQDIAELWSNLAYNNQTGLMHLLTYANSLQLICDSLNIKLMQTVFHYRMGRTITEVFDNSKENNQQFRDHCFRQLERLHSENRLGMINLDKKTFQSKEMDWNDMYYIAITGMDIKDKSHPWYGCHIKEFMHPCEKTQDIYTDQIMSIIDKFNWKFS